jgi:hypothetical protein
MTDLVDAIQQVDALPGGNRLIDRYTRADQHSGALFELDLAATALRRGLIVELEPATQPGRNCDLAVAEPAGAARTRCFWRCKAFRCRTAKLHRSCRPRVAVVKSAQDRSAGDGAA